MLSKPQIRINQGTRRQYSVNESYSASWDERVLDFVNSKKQGDAPIAQRCVLLCIQCLSDATLYVVFGGID